VLVLLWAPFGKVGAREQPNPLFQPTAFGGG